MTSLQSQFAIDLFPFYHLLVGSTDSKQTSKGLFIFQLSFERKNFFSAPFYHANGNQLGDEYKELRPNGSGQTLIRPLFQHPHH